MEQFAERIKGLASGLTHSRSMTAPRLRWSYHTSDGAYALREVFLRCIPRGLSQEPPPTASPRPPPKKPGAAVGTSPAKRPTQPAKSKTHRSSQIRDLVTCFITPPVVSYRTVRTSPARPSDSGQHLCYRHSPEVIPCLHPPVQRNPQSKCFHAIEQIRRRAYELYLRRGNQPGSEIDDSSKPRKKFCPRSHERPSSTA
jgi:hypothetical protein